MLTLFLLFSTFIAVQANVYYTGIFDLVYYKSQHMYNISHIDAIYNKLHYPEYTYITETYFELTFTLSVYSEENSIVLSIFDDGSMDTHSTHSQYNITHLYPNSKEVCFSQNYILNFNRFTTILPDMIEWIITIHPGYTFISTGNKGGGVIASLLSVYIHEKYAVITDYLYLFDTDCSELEQLEHYILQSVYHGYHITYLDTPKCSFLFNVQKHL